MEGLDLRIRYRGHSIDLQLARNSLTVCEPDRQVAPISICVGNKAYELAGSSTRVFSLDNKKTKLAIVEK